MISMVFIGISNWHPETMWAVPTVSLLITRKYFCAKLIQQPLQCIDLLNPIVGSQRHKIHSNQVLWIVIPDALQRCKFACKGFPISVIYGIRHLISYLLCFFKFVKCIL